MTDTLINTLPMVSQRAIRLWQNPVGNVNHAPNIYYLAKEFNIDVEFREPRYDSKNLGVIFFDRATEKLTVWINVHAPEPVKRFTLAHEISHWLNGDLEKGEIYSSVKDASEVKFVNGRYKGRRTRYSEVEWAQERAADTLAAEILMPSRQVRLFAESARKKDLALFAKEFGVTLSCANRRLWDFEYVLKGQYDPFSEYEHR